MNIVEYLEKNLAECISTDQAWASTVVEAEIAVFLHSGYLIRPSQATQYAAEKNWTHPAQESLVNAIQKAYGIEISPETLAKKRVHLAKL